MSKISGIYAAGLSILNKDLSLNVEKTIAHAEKIIEQGCHGVVIFGSTGQAQLIPISEKIVFLTELSKNRFKKDFIIGTGLNSLNETINFLKVATSLNFNKFLIMPPAYYNYGDKEVIEFYEKIILAVPQVKIILYNFEKLCGYKFSIDCVKQLVKKFPNQIVGVKDSTYNLYGKLKIENFSILPGSELKLLEGLKQGCSGIITATCNVTAKLSRKVYDDFSNNNDQLYNEKLCNVRKVFDQYNLISGLHTFFSIQDNIYKNILPPLSLLDHESEKKLIAKLKDLNFSTSTCEAA